MKNKLTTFLFPILCSFSYVLYPLEIENNLLIPLYIRFQIVKRKPDTIYPLPKTKTYMLAAHAHKSWNLDNTFKIKLCLFTKPAGLYKNPEIIFNKKIDGGQSIKVG